MEDHLLPLSLAPPSFFCPPFPLAEVILLRVTVRASSAAPFAFNLPSPSVPLSFPTFYTLPPPLLLFACLFCADLPRHGGAPRQKIFGFSRLRVGLPDFFFISPLFPFVPLDLGPFDADQSHPLGPTRSFLLHRFFPPTIPC